MTGDGLGRGLSDMWRSVLLFVPAALAFIAIVLVGYVLARLLRAAVAKGLRRAGFDKAVERGAAGKYFPAGKFSASDLCARIVFYAVLLFALQLAFGLWGPNPVSDLLTALIAWLPRAFVGIVIIVVAAAVAGAVHDLIAGALGGLGYGRILARAVSVVIVTLGVIAALDQVRIATSVTRPLLIAVLATVAGVVVVGVGGGLIRPMQQRWDGWLDKAGAESAAIREHARAYSVERARQAEETRKAEQEHAAQARAEEERRAEQARAEQERVRAEQTRRAAEQQPGTEETQVIPPPRQSRPRRVTDTAFDLDRPSPAGPASDSSTPDDRPHPVPGFGDDRPRPHPGPGFGDDRPRRGDTSAPDGPGDRQPASGAAGDPAAGVTVITAGAADSTIVNRGQDEPLLIGTGTEDADSTQVIHPAGSSETQALPSAAAQAGASTDTADTQDLPTSAAGGPVAEIAETQPLPTRPGAAEPEETAGTAAPSVEPAEIARTQPLPPAERPDRTRPLPKANDPDK